MGYRTYAAGNMFPTDTAQYREGSAGVCTLPPDPASGQTILSRSYFPSNLDSGGMFPPSISSQAPYVLYRHMYKARCINQGSSKAMEVSLAQEAGDARPNPLNFSSVILASGNGTHIMDVPLYPGREEQHGSDDAHRDGREFVAQHIL